MNNASLVSLVFSFTLSTIAIFVGQDPAWRRLQSASMAFLALAFILPR